MLKMDRMAMPPDELSRDAVTIRLRGHLEAQYPSHAPALDYQIEAAGQVVGSVRVRLGDSEDIKRHFGHIGYEVYPAFRGRGYASLACRLALEVLWGLGYDEAWITCNPDNQASRRVCEKAGGGLAEIVDLPDSHPMYAGGERQKCRYRFAP